MTARLSNALYIFYIVVGICDAHAQLRSWITMGSRGLPQIEPAPVQTHRKKHQAVSSLQSPIKRCEGMTEA
jgi:hypothetical protein